MNKILENSKISTKIMALLLLLGAITSFIAWNGWRTLSQADEVFSDIVNDSQNGTMLARAGRDALSMRFAAYQAMAYQRGTAEAQAGLDGEGKAFEDARSGLIAVKNKQPELQAQVEKFENTLRALHELTARAAQYGVVDQNDQAMALLMKADKLGAAFTAEIKTLNDATIAASNERNKAQTAADSSSATTMLVMAVIGLAGGIGLAFFVSRAGITGPLKKLEDQMGEIARGDYRAEVAGTDRGDEVGTMAKAVRVFRENGIAKQAADAATARADAEQKMVVDTVSSHLAGLAGGDLTTTIKADFPGGYATLKSNFNETLDKLREVIGAVSASTATIRTGAGEIAQASEDLARRTESNAASLEETAAAVTQMDERLKASAQAASQTVGRADQAIATVDGGRAVADEAVQAMGRVSDSAKGIDSVIEGLDKIAFQTRVLAMNAAVEAGRAGDAGRGFAVVADLVSALAMRAEEEAKRARDQLTITQTDIVTAVDAVTKVDEALANITGDVSQVHELLATMAADNQAQSAAITQISAAITTMDHSTQQNASMVEQTSAAARNLSSEVGELAQQASLFTIGDRPPAAVRHAPPPAKARTASPKTYTPPAKALAPALVGTADDDWNSF